MSMMAEFFDITKDSKEIFKDTAIMKTEYANEINGYPTIFLSFADAKGSQSDIAFQIKRELMREYQKHKQVLQNLDMFDQPVFDFVLQGLSQLNEKSLHQVMNAVAFLMKRCHEYYGKRVMLFIDE